MEVKLSCLSFKFQLVCYLLCTSVWGGLWCYTGRCKGYGFVEYAHNHEKSELARQQLDGMTVSVESVLRCQFVPSSLVHFTDLHSRCLLVTNISLTTVNVWQVLSVVSAPTFCQVGQLSSSMLGLPVDWM